jgi:hypothetical protein
MVIICPFVLYKSCIFFILYEILIFVLLHFYFDHIFTSPARKGSNSVEKVLRGSKSKSKMVEKRTGRGVRASTFGFDFQVRAIAEGTIPVAAVVAIRRIGLLYRSQMMKQDGEASFCFKVGYCFKVNPLFHEAH